MLFNGYKESVLSESKWWKFKIGGGKFSWNIIL